MDKKLWFNHAMEYYSAIKRNKVLMHAMTWINLENIKLIESQSQKSHTV